MAKFVTGCRERGTWWFRIRGGYGLHWKNTKLHPLVFSERQRLVPRLGIGNWSFKLLRPYAIALFLLFSASAAWACGVERWPVKSSADADWSKVNLRPLAITIAELNTFPAPTRKALQAATSTRFPAELQAYRVQGWLVGFKYESDQDFHIVVEDLDDPTKTIIVEMPSWQCVPKEFQEETTAMRVSFYKRFGRISATFKRLPEHTVKVEFTGVGFYDFLHGQTGVARNGFELHRVLNWHEISEATAYHHQSVRCFKPVNDRESVEIPCTEANPKLIF